MPQRTGSSKLLAPCLAAFWALLTPACTGSSSEQDAGAGGAGTGGTGGTSGAGTGGGLSPECMAKTVVAPQRVVRLTRTEVVNTIRALIDDEAATTILTDPLFSGLTDETNARFPPLVGLGESTTVNPNPDSFPTLNEIAQRTAAYVYDHFASVTGCATPTDQCASVYLSLFARKAYRHPLTPGEQARISALYSLAKGMTVNGWSVSSTVEEATRTVVHAMLGSPQFLWRSELGDPRQPSTSPPGLPLTEHELATMLAYFLTGSPPDAELASAAGSGALRTNLGAQAERLLATPAARSWLTTQIFHLYRLNLLYNVRVDPEKWPEVLGSTIRDMHDEAYRFLDYTLWNMDLTDILLSRTTFINSNLATNIYRVPVPEGATDTEFAQADLPADQRAGLVTNAAFITSRAGADRESLIQRAILVKDTLLCLQGEGPPDELREEVAAAGALFEKQTGREQVAARAANPICTGCHGDFDAYGLVLDYYDNIGRYRTEIELADGRVVPVDAKTTLPEAFDNAEVDDAIDMAENLAQSSFFNACVAMNVLQYALAEFDTSSIVREFELNDDPNSLEGCETKAVTDTYLRGTGRTFTDLARAVVLAPAFSYRREDTSDMSGGSGGSSGAPDASAGTGGIGTGAGSAVGSDQLKELVLKMIALNFMVAEIKDMQVATPASVVRERLGLHLEAIGFTQSAIESSIQNIGPASQ